MRKWKYAIMLCLLQLFACSEFGEQTEHGFDYHYHRQLGNPRAEIGDELYVQFNIRTDELLLFESPNGFAGMRTVLQDPSLNPIKEPDPIADVLPLMGEGDSVTVRMSVTEDMREAFGLETATFIYYDVALRQIVKEGEARPQAADEEEMQPLVDSVALLQQDAQLREALAVTEEAILPLTDLRQFMASHEESALMESGTFFQIIKMGSRSVVPSGERVQVRYLGAQQDGLLINECFTTEPFTFTRDSRQVIKAWEEALDVISYGGKMLMGVPPAGAYGTAGKPPYIGTSDTIYYYYEVLEQN
ncbi:MAG: FKBP-type peptidyl-prolyl cis-trans isomerase [Bacteroidota bacterium]